MSARKKQQLSLEGMSALGRANSTGSGAIAAALGLRGDVSGTHWNLPGDMDEDEWVRAGLVLSSLDRGHQWWLGDWWAFGEHKYGGRKAIVESPEWKKAGGLGFGACVNAGVVARAFETPRRRGVLSFRHHTEVASLAADEADALLVWAEEPISEGREPRSTRELRSELHRRTVKVGQQPSGETCGIDDLGELARSGRHFGTLYADPPWQYDNQGTRASTGDHYRGLTVDELCAMPVRELGAANSHLHLWITNAFLFDAPRILDAWGFEFRSSFVWAKPQIGLGNYWRNSHEILLTAVRGDALSFSDGTLRSWREFDRGEHSAKPPEVRTMIERASPGPRLELFGRELVGGWTVWGNQVPRTALLEPA